MQIEVVTTCNRQIWEVYGRAMAESFVRYWPKDVHFTVYGDEFFLTPFGVQWRSMKVICWHQAFKQRHADNADAHGKIGGLKPYRRDAYKFSHKVAALTDLALEMREGILIWIDADTFTDRPVTHECLRRWLPPGSPMSLLKRRGTCPECGFMMFDVAAVRDLMLEFQDIYASDQVFKLRETHDSFVMWHLIGKLGLSTYNLTADDAANSHPWIGSDIGRYMDHLKGSRKEMGASPERRIG